MIVLATVGHAYFKLLPSLQGLGREIRDQVRQNERDAPAITLSAQVQTALLREQIRTAAREGNESAVRLLAELDSAPAESQFRTLMRALRGRAVSIGVDIDPTTASRLDAVTGAVTRLSGTSLRIGGLAAAAADLAGVAAAVGQLSGAALLLPAAGVAAGAALGTLALGMQGFGTALSSMDDPAQFAESLNTLSGNARATATEVYALRPAFTGLRLDMQDRLFAGMAVTIAGLAQSYLPVLRGGLAGIATELNISARGFAAFASAPQSLADTSTILGNVRSALAAGSPAATGFAAALRDVVTVGSSFGPGIAASLTQAADRFAAFTASARESGQLAAWMQGGLDALNQLWQVVQNLASIAGSVFGAFNASGAGFLATLVSVTGQLAAFFQTAQGNQVLAGLASVASAAGQVISQVLAVGLAQLAPILINLAPGLATFIGQIGSALVTGLQIAGPLLADLAGFLSQNASWVGPLVLGLGGLAAIAGPLVTGVTAIANAFKLVTLVFDLLKLSLLSNPITLIAAAIAGLAVLIITNWDSVKNFTVGVFTAVWTFLSDLWRTIVDWISARVSDVLAAIGWLGELPGRVGGWFRGVYDGAVQMLSDLLSWLGSLPQRILDALGDLGSLLVNAGKNVIRGLVDGLTAGFGWVRDRLSELTNWITDWKGPPARDRVLLSGNGRLIMGGLLEGLRRGEPAVRTYLNGLTDTLPLDVAASVSPAAAIRPAPAVAGPGGTPPSDAGRPALDAAAMTAAVTAGVLAALQGARLHVDGTGLARLVNAENRANGRR